VQRREALDEVTPSSGACFCRRSRIGDDPGVGEKGGDGPLADLDAVEGRDNIARVIVDEVRGLPDDGFGLPAPRDPRLLRVTTRLAAVPGDRRSLEAWAALAAMSPRTLSRRFVEDTGFTFSEWRQRARLMRAVELLAARRPVTAVALELGYDNVSAFIAAFRRAFGVTPARFRAKRGCFQRRGRFTRMMVAVTDRGELEPARTALSGALPQAPRRPPTGSIRTARGKRADARPQAGAPRPARRLRAHDRATGS